MAGPTDLQPRHITSRSIILGSRKESTGHSDPSSGMNTRTSCLGLAYLALGEADLRNSHFPLSSSQIPVFLTRLLIQRHSTGQSSILRQFYADEPAAPQITSQRPSTSEDLTHQLRRLYSIHPLTTHQAQTQGPGNWNSESGEYPQRN